MGYWLFRGSRDIKQPVDTHGFSLCFGFVTNIAKYLVFPLISDAEERLFESPFWQGERKVCFVFSRTQDTLIGSYLLF